MPYGTGYPFTQLGSAVLAVLLPNVLRTPSLHASRAVWETEKAFTWCKQCSAVAKTSVCYRHHFHHKSKPLYVWRKLTLSLLKPVHKDKKLWTLTYEEIERSQSQRDWLSKAQTVSRKAVEYAGPIFNRKGSYGRGDALHFCFQPRSGQDARNNAMMELGNW